MLSATNGRLVQIKIDSMDQFTAKMRKGLGGRNREEGRVEGIVPIRRTSLRPYHGNQIPIFFGTGYKPAWKILKNRAIYNGKIFKAESFRIGQ